jgi:hypothetical protein
VPHLIVGERAEGSPVVLDVEAEVVVHGACARLKRLLPELVASSGTRLMADGATLPD